MAISYVTYSLCLTLVTSPFARKLRKYIDWLRYYIIIPKLPAIILKFLWSWLLCYSIHLSLSLMLSTNISIISKQELVILKSGNSKPPNKRNQMKRDTNLINRMGYGFSRGSRRANCEQRHYQSRWKHAHPFLNDFQSKQALSLLRTFIAAPQLTKSLIIRCLPPILQSSKKNLNSGDIFVLIQNYKFCELQFSCQIIYIYIY